MGVIFHEENDGDKINFLNITKKYIVETSALYMCLGKNSLSLYRYDDEVSYEPRMSLIGCILNEICQKQ